VDQASVGNGWTMWKAQDETLARAVSVLTFAPGFPRVAEVITAARAASRLTDPRLAQVFDVEDGGDQAYIVMEWVSGDSLAQLVSNGPLDPGQACSLVSEAARAMAGAHAVGQAHLLLSPQTLRWTRSSGIKITGIGIDAALAGAGLANVGDPAATDSRHLAGLLYAALTGYWPCETPSSLPAAPGEEGEVYPPRRISPDISAELDAVVTRALLQRPEHQGPPITTPSALADAIAVVAPPVPLPEPAPRSYDGYNSNAYNSGNSGNRGGYNDGYGDDFGGYPDQGGGMRPTGAMRQSGGFTGEGYRGSNPNDPSTWNTGRGGGTSTYQRDYADRDRGRGRAPMSRGLLGGVAALVVVAVGAAIWGITANLGHGSSGNPQASSTSPAAKGGGTASTVPGTVLTPTGAMSFNILGSSATPEDPSDVTNPLTGKAPAWSTQHYESPATHFGGFKNGDGYLIEMGSSVKLNSVEADFGQSGGAAQICIGNSTTSSSAGQQNISGPCPAGFTPASQKVAMNGDTTFTATSGASGQDILIWFSALPSSGTQTISKVTVKGTAAG
jgi:hypothetical protein